jgi:L-ribulose-5-phosphate 3-epimerase
MQGRLLPPEDNRIQCFPRDNWAGEFPLAAEAGLHCIEWIYDLHGQDVNPLTSGAGIKEMKHLTERCGVEVLSLCADYFIEKPLVRTNIDELKDRWRTLSWLIRRCRLAGIGRVLLPFVDASSLETAAEVDSIVGPLQRALEVAEETHVEIHLETSLPPARVSDLLDRLPHPNLKINYDSGNSASLGYHPAEEFAAYGGSVGSVHIKDRLNGGATVPLGSGNVDFRSLFDCLDKVGYSGDFILQVARSSSCDEVAWANRNRLFVLEYLRLAR